jgi:hypothetical protein
MLGLNLGTLTGCVGVEDEGSDTSVATREKRGEGLDPNVVILDGVVTAKSAPNVSSPWITIHGLTIALFTDDGSLPPQTIDVTCHASRINPTGYDVGQTVHARCDKHRSVLYFEQLYPI